MFSEALVLAAAWKSLLRRPLKHVTDKPGWRRFSAMGTPSYGNTVTMLLLLIVFEAPAVHLILGAVMEDGLLRGLVRGVLLGSSIYVAVWLIGDLRLLRETPGVLLGNDILSVQLGQRINGEVALKKMTAVQRLTTADNTSPDGLRAIRISPLPNPNCRVHLSAEVEMRGSFGLPVRGKALDIYVDDPDGLVAAIRPFTASAMSRREGCSISKQ